MNGQETEVKFYVGNLAKIESRLIELGGQLIQPRVHETNLRFDTPEHTLRNEGKVLRLRQDENTKMTFKSGTIVRDGIVSRKEIEFGVESFEAARELIESLGYGLTLLYEKYRRTYEINDLHVMLDELPYGDFVEIEGEDTGSIRNIAEKIRLRWEAAITASYSTLFERIAESRKLDRSKLTFEVFAGGKPSMRELSVTIADYTGI